MCLPYSGVWIVQCLQSSDLYDCPQLKPVLCGSVFDSSMSRKKHCRVCMSCHLARVTWCGDVTVDVMVDVTGDLCRLCNGSGYCMSLLPYLIPGRYQSTWLSPSRCQLTCVPEVTWVYVMSLLVTSYMCVVGINYLCRGFRMSFLSSHLW